MKKKLLLLCQIILTIWLVSFVVQKANFNNLIAHIYTFDGLLALSVGTCIVLLKTYIAGARQAIILKLYKKKFDALWMFKLTLISNFFAQTTIAFIGGDAIRIIYLARKDVSVRDATSAVLLDKIIGFISLLSLFLISLPFLSKIMSDNTLKTGVWMVMLAGLSATIAFITLGFIPERLRHTRLIGPVADFMSLSRHLFHSYKQSIYAFILSFQIHLLTVLAVYCIARIYSVDISIFWALVLVPPIIFISTLPISLAGWGVRESAMIVGFGLLGYESEAILAVSITLGIALVLAGLPGAFLFAFKRNKSLSATTQSPQML